MDMLTSIDVKLKALYFGELMNAPHLPVLLNQVLSMLAPTVEAQPDLPLRYLDGTFGRGGHLRALLEKYPQVSALAFDQDPEAIAYARENFSEWIAIGRLQLHHGNFSEYTAEKFGSFDLMLLDLGVSSPQLDQGLRGFSFYHEGPLDMRMNNSTGPTAADIIREFSEEELNELFKTLGEVQRPYRVTRAIVHDRGEKPFLNTRDLAGLIERVEGWHRKGHHPATQYFLALRLQVNRELEVVENSLENLAHGLKSKGRLAVLTFHSLEDRIVKNKFKELAETMDAGSIVNKKVIQAEWNEAKENPRARSAKLRVFERSNRS
ncbi:MAG: 16S rRNA (cytosine(1402)-N(4))-methyltransferase RsmH [Pseudobdellovibrionaceae bacterium]